MDYLMSKQLADGVCEKCFSFGGICDRIDPAFPKSSKVISYPVCLSTLHPSVGYCTHTPSGKVSAASKKSRPTAPKSKSTKSKKVIVYLGSRKVEQAHFNDYLKQLKQEKKGRNLSNG